MKFIPFDTGSFNWKRILLKLFRRIHNNNIFSFNFKTNTALMIFLASDMKFLENNFYCNQRRGNNFVDVACNVSGTNPVCILNLQIIYF